MIRIAVAFTATVAACDAQSQPAGQVSGTRETSPTLRIENQPWSGAFYEGVAALGRADYERAIPAFEQVRNSIQPRDRNDEIAVGFAANNLGSVYARLGRYVEAEPAFRQAVSIFERVLGAGDPQTGVVLNNLASFYSKTGRDPEAAPLLRRALEIHRAALGESDPQVANDWNNLGAALLNQQKFAEAEPLFRRAIRIGESVRPAHPRLADFLANLGALDLRLHRFAEAEQLLRRALDLQVEVSGSDSPGATAALGHLAELAILQNDFARSCTLFGQMLPMAVRVFGPNHPRTADAVFGLAVTYHREGQLRQSEQLFLRLMEIDAAGSVTLHDRAVHLAEYAVLLRQMHRSKEATSKEELSGILRRRDPLQAFTQNTVDAAVLAK